MKFRSVLYGLLGASVLALGAGEALRAAPGEQILTSLSGSYLVSIDTGGSVGTATTLTTLGSFIGGSAVATNITSSSATAFTVGPNGTTGPGFTVDASTASAAAGLAVTGLASTSGVTLTATGGATEPIWIAGKSTGPVYIGGTTTTLAGLQVAQTASRVNDIVVTPGATGTLPSIASGGAGADSNIGVSVKGSGTGRVYVGGTAITAGLQVAQTASAVNDVLITNGATGNAPTITLTGSSIDTNVGLSIAANGTGPVLLGGTTTTLAGVQIAQTASRVNDLLVTPGATGTSVILDANSAGADTNAGITMATKGSGKVALGSITTCSGTTTATCTAAQRFVVSVTGLTTAAGAESAAMTVTDSTATSSAVPVICQVNGYSGTGKPMVYNVTVGTASVAFTILNVATSGSLNATVPVACAVL